jgi:hypothetical protein
MLIIPIADTPSQTLNILLAAQSCTINLYEKSTGFYCDLYVSDVLIIGGVICQNLNRIVRSVYLGFVGDLMFYDTQGTTTVPSTGLDPTSPGLGTRYLFCYLSQSDLNGQG